MSIWQTHNAKYKVGANTFRKKNSLISGLVSIVTTSKLLNISSLFTNNLTFIIEN